MSEKEWYHLWFDSPFYHQLYFDRDETEARAFIFKLISHLQPHPSSRILDVACGRGRHSKILAEQGFDVTGIDLSMDSIHFAKQFENDHLHFYQHDMRLPAWINFFDYAFNFYTSFGYFNTRREHQDAVQTIVKSLKAQGVVLFDYLNAHYVEQNLVHNEFKKVNDTGYEIHRWMDEAQFYKKITVTDPSLRQPATFTEKVAKLSLGDFTEMLSYNHMQVLEIFGDYDFRAYDLRKTPRMILLAKKV